jgi:phenylacetate-CoA ligase
VGYTSGDIDRWAELMARGMYCANIGKNDIVQVAYGYGLFTGGLGAHYGAERVGASVIPISGGNTTRQMMLIQDFGSTALCCTPSYALNLAEALQAEGVTETKLKSGVFGAEPWTEHARKIEENAAHRRHHNYGPERVMGPGVSVECMCKVGMHIWEDHFLPEVIGENGRSLPYGERGDLTFTTLTKHGMPLLRYRTHDLCTLTDEPCACGRTHARYWPLGRARTACSSAGVNVLTSPGGHGCCRWRARAAFNRSWSTGRARWIPWRCRWSFRPSL